MTYGADWRIPRGINPRWQRHSLIDTGMPTKQQMAMELCEHLLESLADLRKATRATEVTTRRALRIVEAGGDVAAGLAVAAPSATRQNMNDALEAVEKTRHDVRLLVFAAGLDEGMTIGELGRAFGFSRQLASRYAREARQRTEVAR